VRHLAEDIEMLWYYDFVYWYGSQGTHASAIAVEAYVGMSPQGTVNYRMGPSVKGLRGELAVCCDLLIRALVALDGLCKLRLAALFNELVPEYKAAMGGEPVAEMIGPQ
jgi:hypothetical protein